MKITWESATGASATFEACGGDRTALYVWAKHPPYDNPCMTEEALGFIVALRAALDAEWRAEEAAKGDGD